jgi:hypothetical protein
LLVPGPPRTGTSTSSTIAAATIATTAAIIATVRHVTVLELQFFAIAAIPASFQSLSLAVSVADLHST